MTTRAMSSDLRADIFGLWRESLAVLLLLGLDPFLHLDLFGMLALHSEDGLARRHLVDEATQTPPVGTHAVIFVGDHLRGCAWDGRKILVRMEKNILRHNSQPITVDGSVASTLDFRSRLEVNLGLSRLVRGREMPTHRK